MATISLGMIVRNEARTIDELLRSVLPFVNEIVIGLAGESTDDTEKILKGWQESAPEIFTIFPIEWEDDFSKARNEVLRRTTGDYFLWLDGDDILIGGEKLRGYIDRFPEADAFYLGYDYSRDENGLNTCYLIRERLVKRHPELAQDWVWKGAVHEVLIAEFEPVAINVQDIVVRHERPADKITPGRNLSILHMQLEEQEPNPDPRILSYLGSETAGMGKFDEAIIHLRRFVRLSGWDQEKYQAQVKISHYYRLLNNTQKALQAAYDAIAILPDWPDAYYSLAKTFLQLENPQAAIEWLKIGTSKPKPETFLIVNPLEYTYEPLVLLGTAYIRLNDWEIALQNLKQAYAIKQDAEVAKLLLSLREELRLQNVVQSFLNLREHLGRYDEWLKVRRLFDAIPKHIQEHPQVQEVWARSMQQTAHVLEPQIMVDFYRQNPHWAPMDDERILDSEWLKYPRLAFALSVAQRVGAETIVDWGCSDGFISLPLAREGFNVRGIDLDPRCVDLAEIRAKKWGVPASFEVGNVDEDREWGTEKADLALIFEVLEHVIDPEVTLERLEKTSKHIALTTPYLAWESGNIEQWDKIEPKGHLRIFDLRDMEALLSPRGKIWNLYKQPWGTSGWIFADYEPGVVQEHSVTFLAPGSIESWDPRKWETGGLGGSETAIIKLGEEFAQQHRVYVYTNTDSPGYYNGLCFRDQQQFHPQVGTDLLIAWRLPEAADWNINCRRLVLWMHDTDAGDRLTEDRAARFDYIVVQTEWHKQYMLSLYPFLDPNKLQIIGNGVDISRFDVALDFNKYKIVYASSPDRGLDLILEYIWPRVIEAVPQAELHIYYGWESFNAAATLYPQLAPFKAQMDHLLLNSKKVVLHGRINQAELAREFQDAAIWLYPTYFPETYCITAVEAQLGGAIPVTNRYAGLAETVNSGVIIDGDVRDPKVLEGYVQAVLHLLRQPKSELVEFRRRVIENAPAVTWSQRAQAWLQLVDI